MLKKLLVFEYKSSLIVIVFQLQGLVEVYYHINP